MKTLIALQRRSRPNTASLKSWWENKLKSRSFVLFCLIIFGITLVPTCSYAQTEPLPKAQVTLKVSYANDTAQSYAITLHPQEKYTLSQSYSWVRDQNSRYNLQAYSIDNNPYQSISRVARGNFTLDIPTDSSHSVVFLAVTQYPIELNGTDSVVFSPPSPTNDNWFDLNSDTVVSIPYVEKLDQNSRNQLTRWSLDGSNQIITRQENGTFSTSSLSISGPHTVNFEYVTQYYVSVLSEFGHVTGSGWYDSGSTATISVMSAYDFPIGHTFVGWQGSSSSNTKSISILVDSPKTLTANWQSDYSAVITIGTIIAGSAAGTAVVYKKRKSSLAVQPRVDQKEDLSSVQQQSVQSAQIDNTYAKELTDYILQKSLEKLDLFQTSGVLSPQRHDKLKEDLTKDGSGD